jgi:ectoine hydroxylase
MDLSSLEHQLSAEESAAFERDGFIIIDNALSSSELATYAQIADDLSVEERRARSLKPAERVDLRDIVGRRPPLLELVDWPTTLPKVWGILGWNIAIYHTLYMEAPPGLPADSTMGSLGWHRDTGVMNRDIETQLQPRISVKVAYFLSDCSQPGRANFWAIPGSHLHGDLNRPEDGTQPEGAAAIMVPAGAALVFDRRLWHASSPNTSQITRKVLFYGYSYRWLRPRDDQTVEHLVEQSDPIRRQLLGHAPTGNYGYSSPTEEDVPLRAWLREHVGGAAAE